MSRQYTGPLEVNLSPDLEGKLEEAAADLEQIADYLFEHAADRAERLVRALYDAPATQLMFPNRGRAGKKEGTRELVMSPFPYIVDYAVRGGAVYVVRILHGAQQWP
jgi:toxin ParE1/3/4